MNLDENEILLQKVKATRRLERVLDHYDGALSSGVKEHLRAALDLLDRDFRKAFGKTLPRKTRARPKEVKPPADVKAAEAS